MHQLPIARLSALVIALAIAGPAAVGPVRSQTRPAVVSVLYAASLVTPMEGPVKAALAAQNITFEGEPGGSKKLANLIAAGLRQPDIFISVDPRLVEALGPRIARATTFASTSLGIAWANNSRAAALLAKVAAGTETLDAALSSPGFRLGRTDPRLDPKGVYTVEAAKLWLGAQRAQALLGDDENAAQIFPEEDLLARVETGEIDAGFFYRTEAAARGFTFVPLPGRASMSDKITYTLAAMSDSPHPEAAAAFESFALSGEGRKLLEKAGLTYLDPLINLRGNR